MGWHEQGDGRWFYGLNVENGRIKDTETFRLKTALREICTTLEPGIRLTPHQSIIFADLEMATARLEEILRRPWREPLGRDLQCPPVVDGLSCIAHLRLIDHRKRTCTARDHRRWKWSCKKLGLEDEVFTVRMTGCPNGLCPALQLRHRLGGQGERKIHGLRRGSRVRRSAEFYLQRPGSCRGRRVHVGPATGLFQARTRRRRRVRRFLPPQGK